LRATFSLSCGRYFAFGCSCHSGLILARIQRLGNLLSN
jgi:hypothetical protein